MQRLYGCLPVLLLLFVSVSLIDSLSISRSLREHHLCRQPTAMSAITKVDMEEREASSASYYWCPKKQIYVGGVPENAVVDELISNSDGYLRLFGYGSLCWNPGTDTGALAHPSVSRTTGRAKGYRRCWAQKSTDHRGTTSFPGIVCTLLTDDEFRQFRTTTATDEQSMTEGVIYLVPPPLVRECLAELDFREKGGYARDVIDVQEDESKETVQCLLYRGTPENPAFWPRALKCIPFAAAVISAAVGPSGPNEEYLHRLDQFLEATSDGPSLDDTLALARFERQYQNDYDKFFFVGCGSNKHNQLLLRSAHNAADLVNHEDAHTLTESVLFVPATTTTGVDPVVELIAGSGHSGAITASGRLFLFGWNSNGQLGSCQSMDSEVSVISELQGLMIDTASLGFSHTLVVTKENGRLFAFGDNSRGQVTGIASSDVTAPVTPMFLANETVAQAAAGLYHSAVITKSGDVIVYGCSRFGQSLSCGGDAPGGERWRPDHGAATVKVACGRYHTLVLDTLGRVWSFGDNRLGQLGRLTDGKESASKPGLVSFPAGYGVVDINCGWSHNVALASDSNGRAVVFGWGRSDKGQLGTAHPAYRPVELFPQVNAVQVRCGSEFTVLVDDKDAIWCCGWNEHGNLSTGNTDEQAELAAAVGASVTATPGYQSTSLCVAAGGAHLLIGRLAKRVNI
jgi:alpha-tubulin suppressor-like RCC1 family protein/cation transport regulator ChaC